jgi:hypothetical protein
MVLLVGVVAVVGACGNMPGYGEISVDEEGIRESVEASLAEARQHCVPIPVGLADQIADGLVGYIPGEWRGRPGELIVIDYVTMTAFRWPPRDHIVNVAAAIPNTQGGVAGQVQFTLLIEGSLDSPETIRFLTNSSSDLNPTGFETVVRDDRSRPYHSPMYCADVGAETGPYRTDQLGAG